MDTPDRPRAGAGAAAAAVEVRISRAADFFLLPQIFSGFVSVLSKGV
jgi:hypothetical protein